MHIKKNAAGESNPHRPFGPTDFRTTSAFAAAPRGVRGLDYPFAMAQAVRRRPSSLYTFPARGLARDCRVDLGFPEFERFYSLGFPKGTPSKSAASTNFATPACRRSSRFRSVGQVMAQQFQIRLKLSRDCVPRGMKIIVPPPTAL